MHRIVAGGTGLIGRHLIHHWLDNGVDITVIGRSKKKIHDIFGDKVEAMTWQDCEKMENINVFKSADVLVNLCGAGVADKNWSSKRKKELIDSRVNTTKKCVKICIACGDMAPRLLNASAIGTYGLQDPKPNALPKALDEDSHIEMDEANDFLAEIGRKWELALAPMQENKLTHVILRFGVVLSPEGGALPKFLDSYKFGFGVYMGPGYQPMTWISMDDLIAAIDFITIHPDMSGPVNCVAPKAVTHREFTATLSKVMHCGRYFLFPSFLIKLIFGQMGEECLTRGQHVIPKRLQEAGFTFYHLTLSSALESLLKK